MILIVILDKNNGMLFNKRRQSKDRAIVERIIDLCRGNKLYMNKYSSQLFDNDSSNFVVSNNFLYTVGVGQYCLVETEDIANYTEEIEKVVVFRWDKVYPSDLYFNFDLNKFHLVYSEQFVGNSHDNIGMEVYCIA